MKKILAIVALLSCGAGAAYGFTSTWLFPTAAGVFQMGTGSATGGKIDFKPSANVAMVYDSALAVGVSYTVGSLHAQGSRAFGTSSVDTNIFFVDITPPGVGTAGAAPASNVPSGTTFPATLAATPTGYFSAGWTASK